MSKRKRDLYPLSLGKPLATLPSAGRVMLQWIPQPDRPRLHPYFVGDAASVSYVPHSATAPACWVYGDSSLHTSRINDVWWSEWRE
jgi:hypothetical protein